MLSNADGFEAKNLVDAVSPGDKGLLIRSQEGGCSVLPLPDTRPRAATTRLINLPLRSLMLQDARLHVWVVGGKDDGLRKAAASRIWPVLPMTAMASPGLPPDQAGCGSG